MLQFSVGAGRRAPQGATHDTADLGAALAALPRVVESWWSPNVWEGSYRKGENWRSACAVAVDVDHHDGDRHVEPLDAGASVLATWTAEALPGGLLHLTPRGFRVVFPFAAQVTDRTLYLRAARGACVLLSQALQTTGLDAEGYTVDVTATVDLARFLYAPGAIVEGKAREAAVLDLIGREPVDPLLLAAANAPPPPPPPPPVLPPMSLPGGGLVVSAPPPDQDMATAAEAWNRDHPLTWVGDKRNSLPCPACGCAGCFGVLPEDSRRWYCFNTDHLKDAPGCGIQGAKGCHGDTLDLFAWGQRKSRRTVLVESGYLKPAERVLILTPGVHVKDDGTAVEVGADDFAAAVLAALPPDLLYRRERVVGELVGASGRRQWRTMCATRLRLLMDQHTPLGRWVRGERKDGSDCQVVTFVPTTNDNAALVLEAASIAGNVRVLQHLVAHPVFAGSDWHLAAPGWNELTGVFYDEPPDLRGFSAQAVDPQQALDLLDDLVVDFPFRGEADRQNWYAAALTLLCQPALDGNLPLFLVMASMERTGKSLLVNLLGWALMDRDVPTLQMGLDEAEREKRITGLILEGATLTHLDNLPTSADLDSAALASLLTTRTWKGRILGRSELPSLPNTLLLVGSGNNVRASAEIAKRTVPIVLQTGTPNPEARADFRHPDLRAHVRRVRRQVLEALVGIVLSWRAASAPGTQVRLGGFEGWTKSVGGILLNAARGACQFLANLPLWRRVSDDSGADMENLAALWWDAHKATEVTTGDLLRLVTGSGIFPRVLAREERGQAIALARMVLRPMVDRPVSRWIVRCHASGSASLYRLELNPLLEGEPIPGPTIPSSRLFHGADRAAV